MEQKRIFRSSIGGFHKEDVNNYIAELSRRMEELSATRQQTEQRMLLLQEESEQKSRDVTRLERELFEAREQLEAARSGNELLLEKARSHFEDKARAARELGELRDELSGLRHSIPQLTERAERFDLQSKQIAEVLIDARAEAERIVEAAQVTSDVIHARLRDEIARVSDTLGRIFSDYATLQQQARQQTAQLDGMLQQLFDELEDTKARIDRVLPKEAQKVELPAEEAPAPAQ